MHSFNDSETETPNNNVALRFKAHEAIDTAKKIIKDCYVNTDDGSDEENYRYCLESLVEARDNLPSLPKIKGNTEERRRQKQKEFNDDDYEDDED